MDLPPRSPGPLSLSDERLPIQRRSQVGGWPIAIVGIILVLLAYVLRYTLIPFVFAAVIGFVLDPLLVWSAQRTRGHRWPMATLLSILIVVFVLGAGWWIGNQSLHEAQTAIKRIPGMIEGAAKAIGGPGGISIFGAHYTPQQLRTTIITGATNLLSAAQIMLAVKIGIGTIAGIVLTLVLIPYFLVSGHRIASGCIWLVPPERRTSIEAMLPVLVPLLRRYVVGLMCVVAYAAVAGYIGFGPVFHVPGAALLAVVTGFLELIPVVGPITSIVLVGLAAAQQGGHVAIFLVAWELILRLSIDNLVGPLLLGKSTTVHPIVVIFGFIVGAVLFGIIGLLLAVPIAASIRIILEHYYGEPIAPGGSAEPEVVRVLDSERIRPR